MKGSLWPERARNSSPPGLLTTTTKAQQCANMGEGRCYVNDLQKAGDSWPGTLQFILGSAFLFLRNPLYFYHLRILVGFLLLLLVLVWFQSVLGHKNLAIPVAVLHPGCRSTPYNRLYPEPNAASQNTSLPINMNVPC